MLSVKKIKERYEVRISGLGKDLCKELAALLSELHKEGMSADLLHTLVDAAIMTKEDAMAEIIAKMPAIYERAQDGDETAKELVQNFFDLLSSKPKNDDKD